MTPVFLGMLHAITVIFSKQSCVERCHTAIFIMREQLQHNDPNSLRLVYKTCAQWKDTPQENLTIYIKELNSHCYKCILA